MKFRKSILSLTLIFVSLTLTSCNKISDWFKNIKHEHSFENYMVKTPTCSQKGLVERICRDCGENAIASKVELVGKCAILLLTLPMLKVLLELAKEMMYA